MWLILTIALAAAGTAAAQRGAQQARFWLTGAEQRGPQLQPLVECGPHGDFEILCGAHSPEDLELAPDGKYLTATEFVRNGHAGMALFDLAKKTFTKMNQTAQPDKTWGDAACPGPIGDALVSHGSSLARRSNGVWELYVVNHGGRESIEMFELKPADAGWTLIWHGCVVGAHDYNDVAILPDGGFFATYPTGLLAPENSAAAFSGAVSGYVVRWTPGKGESEIKGTRLPYPNGVAASPDGRYMYMNAFTAREVHKFDMKEDRELGSVKVDFLPDNLTWTKEGRLLAAGVKGALGDCPAGSGRPCIQSFGVAEIDPETMQARKLFDSSTAKEPISTGVSVALEVGDSLYLGAFLGDRLVKIPYKK
jgi:hypothetical protein